MFWSYLCIMLPDNELQQHWFQLEYALTERLGKKLTLEDILLFIGVGSRNTAKRIYRKRKDRTDASGHIYHSCSGEIL